MKIVLLECIDEAKAFLEKYGKDFLSENVVIVCLHPKVRAFLKEKGIASQSTINYLDNDSQHRIILESERLTTLISEKVDLSDKFGITQGYKRTFIHHMRLYLNHFFWIIEILSNIKKRHEIDGICCCLPQNPEEIYAKKAHIQNQERFLGSLAKDFCAVHNLSFQGIPIKTKKNKFFLRLATIIARKIAEVIGILNYKILTVNKKDFRKTIIVPALSYRMDTLLEELKQKIPNVKCFMVWEGKDTLKQEIYKIYLVLSNYIKRIKGKSVVEGIISLELIRNRFKKDAKQQSRINKEFEKLKNILSSELKESLVYGGISFSPYFLG